MTTANRPVVNLLVHACQNTDNPEQLLAWVGAFLEGLGRANGMDPQTMAHELRRFLDHAEQKTKPK